MTWGIVPPIDQNGVITMYEVLYEPLETFGGAISPMTEMITPPTMSVSLTQLEEYVVYRISIRAFTQAGAGGYTAAIQTRTSEDGKEQTDFQYYLWVVILCRGGRTRDNLGGGGLK